MYSLRAILFALLGFFALFSIVPFADTSALPSQKRIIAGRQEGSDQVQEQVAAIFNTASSAIASPLAQIKSLTASGDKNAADYQSPISAIDAALQQVASSLESMASQGITTNVTRRSFVPDGFGAFGKRQNVIDDLNAALDALLDDLQKVLDELLGANIPGIGSLLSPIAKDLNEIIAGLKEVLKGVLDLLRDLLTALGNALSGLGAGGLTGF